MSRPRVNHDGQKELNRIEEQINQSVELNVDRQSIPISELEPQTKVAQVDLEKSSAIYLKPKRTFPSREKFNEKFRDDYNFQKEYIEFIAENHEVKGENIDFCIKKFPGTPVEEWVIPVNVAVAAPRYVKNRLDECGYSVFMSSQKTISSEEGMTYFGQMTVEERRPRLSARDVPRVKRIYMGNRVFA